MSEGSYRALHQRRHRVLGNYLAAEAWSRGLDCIVLCRADLEKFLGLKRFKSARIEWLLSDLEPWFPYQVPYYKANALSSIHSLFLSRWPIEEHLSEKSMTTEKRIERMSDDAPRTSLFSDGEEDFPSESEIVSTLAVRAAGLDAPRIKVFHGMFG